jgi:hypothetical protein
VFYYFCLICSYYAFLRVICILKWLTPFYLRFEEQVKKEFKKSSEKVKEFDELDSEKCANEKCCKNCESSKNVVEGKKKR